MPDSRMYEIVQDDDVVSLREYLSRNPHMVLDEDDGGYTILMEAARLGSLEIVQCLVECGAKVDAYSEVIDDDRDERGSALAFALANFHREIAMYLIEKGEKTVNTAYYLSEGDLTPYWERENSTCFMYAMDRQDVEMLDLMICYGLRLNDFNAFCPKDGEELPPLFYAIYEANPAMVNWLMEKGADPLKRFEIYGLGEVNAFMYAVDLGINSTTKPDERYAIVEMLWGAGADLSWTYGGSYRETVRDVIADAGDPRYIRILGL